MKVSDKIEKVSEQFTVYRYDNGFMIEVSGRDNNEDYKTAKILVQDVDQLLALVKEAATMKVDD
jgi:hypothetical protein